MEPRKFWFEGPAGKLEAILRVTEKPTGGALVAHPHPLHEGTMDNAVVFHAERELHRLGLTTMRFNFRGVGGSEGEHDEGRGEVDDVTNGLSWLRGLLPECRLLAVGYSFGSWCAIRAAANDSNVIGMIAIGLPVRMYDFEEAVATLQKPLVVIQGSEDEFGSPDEVRGLLRAGDPAGSIVTVNGAPHLFPGQAREVAAAVAAAARGILRSDSD
jgi:hypothetical protein